MQSNPIDQNFVNYQYKVIKEQKEKIAQLDTDLKGARELQNKVQKQAVIEPVVTPIKTVSDSDTVIKNLAAKLTDLTKQLDKSDKQRQIDQAKLIEEAMKRPFESVVATETTIEYWNLPYVFEVNADNEEDILADEPFYLYVQEDDSRGLRVPGRNGYIKNDGPGNIVYRLNNGVKNSWSYPATIMSGEMDTFDIKDNIKIVIVEITADTDKTRFRTRFTPGPIGD